MLKVYIGQNPTETHLVRGLLETHDIACCVKGETLFSVRGEVPITSETAPSVWIYDDEDFEKAKGIVKEYENTITTDCSTESMWECSSCGEELEGQFTDCWKCGMSKK